ncbi:unnamed protein product [Ceratitis capitata]|uniref:(Mediterranean fruit fly) hypothetical protein n=1 Tax=Ceratitis capitata TaxID=7213 RepID=A0A811UQD9_CERCA|nr:unnamed protein product [Ceratitis capitata]
MTGGANIPAIGKICNTQNTGDMSPGRNANAYQNLLTQGPPHLTHGRYMQNRASGVGGVVNSHAREHRFQQHHHHPQQLTIAFFMQQELLNENTTGVGNAETSLINGTGDNSGINVNNNSSNFANQQLFRYHHRRDNNYSTSHYHLQYRISNTQQHSYITVQTSFHSSNENVNVNSRVSRSCGRGAYTQQHSKHNKYQSRQNNGDDSINPHNVRDVLEEAGAGSENNASKGNFSRWSSKRNQRSLDDKRLNCTSSASKHLSSSSTNSAASSNSFQTSTPSYRQQKKNVLPK